MTYKPSPGPKGHHTAPDYSVDVYINYARSVFLDVERRVIDNPPSRPASFWRLVDEATQRARWRMKRLEHKP